MGVPPMLNIGIGKAMPCFRGGMQAKSRRLNAGGGRLNVRAIMVRLRRLGCPIVLEIVQISSIRTWTALMDHLAFHFYDVGVFGFDPLQIDAIKREIRHSPDFSQQPKPCFGIEVAFHGDVDIGAHIEFFGNQHRAPLPDAVGPIGSGNMLDDAVGIRPRLVPKLQIGAVPCGPALRQMTPTSVDINRRPLFRFRIHHA